MPTTAQIRRKHQECRLAAFTAARGCCQLQRRHDCLGPHTPVPFTGQYLNDHGYLVRLPRKTASGRKVYDDRWACWRCAELPPTTRARYANTPNPSPRPDWSAAYYGN